jgi:hypothetical protein
MTDKPKSIAKFEAAYAQAMKLNPAGANLVLTDCARQLRKISRRVDPLPGEYEEIKVSQTNGPTLEYHAVNLAQFNSRSAGRERWTIGSIDQTPAGAYVAVLERCSDTEGEIDLISALVVEPGPDEAVRRQRVMDHFEWSDAARGMAKKLGWSIILEVD